MPLPNLDRLLQRAGTRARIADSLWLWGRVAVPVGLVIAATAVFAVRRGWAPTYLPWLALVPIPATWAWAWFKPRNRRDLARRIDDFCGLHDQLGSALELSSQAPRAGSSRAGSSVTAAITRLIGERAEALAPTLSWAPAFPLRVPKPRLTDALALAALALAAWVPMNPTGTATAATEREAPAPVAPDTQHAKLDMALAAPLRHSLTALAGREDQAGQTAQAVLELLDALERGEISRDAALARLDELQAALDPAAEQLDREIAEDPAMLALAVDELAQAFSEEDLTAAVGRALDEGEGEQAEQALGNAADQAEQDAAAADQLDRALAKADDRLARAQDPSATADTSAAREQAERRLRSLQAQKPETPEQQREHERRLKRQQERVEQLRRQQQRELAAQRKIDELRRQARQAANSRGNQGQRQDAMDRLGRGMSQAARQARSAGRMSGAQGAITEAKTLVRQAGAQGADAAKRREQVRRFDQAAKGQRPGQDKGKNGKDGKSRSTLLVEGEVGQGPPDVMFEDPNGQGQDDGGEQGGDDQGGDGQAGDSASNADASPAPGPGDGMGQGSQDPLADPSDTASTRKNLKVSPQGGRGQTKAEILRDAAQRGFASEPYRKMFQEYRDFAQSTLDSEALSAAQRRLVQRYYQLIQARQPRPSPTPAPTPDKTAQ